MFIQTWLLPFMLLLVATVVAFPLSKYMAWIMDGKYRPWRVFGWFERRLDSGPQNWKQYTASMLVFNTVALRLRLSSCCCSSRGCPSIRAA